MARRAGKVWSPGVGWVSKREVEQRDYSSFESEWWAFLVWVIRWYPDKGCDLFRDEYADYANEEIMQRLMMRAYARYADVAFTGTASQRQTRNSNMSCWMVWYGRERRARITDRRTSKWQRLEANSSSKSHMTIHPLQKDGGSRQRVRTILRSRRIWGVHFTSPHFVVITSTA